MNHSLIAGALFVLAATPALAMEMTEVPAHVAEVARHFAPEAKWESAGTDFDTQLMAPEYEIKGKTADGKGIEIDVSPEGNLHEIELVIDESSVPPRPYPVRRRVSRPAWVCDEVRSTMVAFFVPGLNREEAEKVYAAFQRPPYPPVHPTARLYSIDFRQGGFDCTATVGEEMTGWPDWHGKVLGIIESTNHIMIYTERSAVRGDIVNVGSDKVTAREYFEDYLAN